MIWNRSEVSGQFWNVVLEKDGEDQLDRSCEKWRSITQSQGGEEYPAYNKKKANWIGHILRRNCLLKHVIEGKLEGRIEMSGRRGRRRKQLLDDLKEKRRYWKLKEEALDRTLWRTRFGRVYGPVVRQTTEWMNTCFPSTGVASVRTLPTLCRETALSWVRDSTIHCHWSNFSVLIWQLRSLLGGNMERKKPVVTTAEGDNLWL
jgi:hypothetical protein